MRSSFFWGLVFLFTFLSHVGSAHAQSPLLIGEVGWAGSEASAADEWLELWNTSDTPISLDNYTLTGAGGTTGISLSGHTIAPRSAFLVANYAETDTKSTLNAKPDLVTTTISLPNDKLLIKLMDGNGAVIDAAGDGGTPFAGASLPKKISMIRANVTSNGAVKASWKSAEIASGFDPNANELGTPGTCDECTQPTSTQEPTPVITTTPPTEPSPSPDPTPVPPSPEPVTDPIPISPPDPTAESATTTEPAPTEQIPATEATTTAPDVSSATNTIIAPSDTTSSTEVPTTTEANATENLPTSTSTVVESPMIDTVTTAATTTVTTTTVATTTIATTTASPVIVITSAPPPIIISSSPPPTSTGAQTPTPIKKTSQKKTTPKKETPPKQAPQKSLPTPAELPKKPTPKKVASTIAHATSTQTSASTSTSMQPTTKKTTTRNQKSSISTTVRVRLMGTVVTPKHWLENAFILQAPDGKGLLVNLGSYHDQPPIGTYIRVTGALKHTTKGTTLAVGKNDGWSILNAHASTTTSTVDLLAPGEEDQWRLIELQGTVNRVRAKSIDLDVQDTTLSIRLRPSVNYRLERLHAGDTVRIMGVIDTSGYEPILYPRIPEDISVLAIAQKPAGTTTAPVGSNLPPWTPFGVAGATVAFSEGWRRVRKQYEDRKIQKLLHDERHLFIS